MSRTYLDPIREALAVRALRDHVEALTPDGDERLLIDCIEGETSFLEMVDRLLEQIAEAQGDAKKVAERIDALEARQARYVRRADETRRLLERAMAVAELPKIERPTGTLSLRAGPPRVEVTDEAAIPAHYWKQPPKTLDKAALRDDLKARRKALEALPVGAPVPADLPPPVPGATLSNGAPSLSIRVA
jgi:hypothetical protein